MSFESPLGLAALLLIPLLVLWHVRRRRPPRVVVPSLAPFEAGGDGPPPRPRRVLDLSLLLQCLVVAAGAVGIAGASCAAPGPVEWSVVVDRSHSMQGRAADVVRLLGEAIATAERPPDRLVLRSLDGGVADVVAAQVGELDTRVRELLVAGEPPVSDGLPGSLASHLVDGAATVLVTDRPASALRGDARLHVLSIGVTGPAGALVGYLPESEGSGRLRVLVEPRAWTESRRASFTVRVGDVEHPLDVGDSATYADVPIAAPVDAVELAVRVATGPGDATVDLDRATLLPRTAAPVVHVGPGVPEVVSRLLDVWEIERATSAASADIRVRADVAVDESEPPTVWFTPAHGPLVRDGTEEPPFTGADVIGSADAPTLPAATTRLTAPRRLAAADALWRVGGDGVVVERLGHTVIALRPVEPWVSDASFPALMAHTLDRLAPDAGRPPRIARDFVPAELLPPAAEIEVPRIEDARVGRRRVELTAWSALGVLLGLLGLLLVERAASRRS